MRHRILPRRLSGVFWLLSSVLVLLVALRLQRQSSTFPGIADASENVASTEAAAEIGSVSVIPGQKVSEGDTLVHLRRPELEVRISEISRQLQGAVGSASRNDLDVDRRSAQIRTEFDSRKAALLAQIRNLEEERGRNRELVASFRGGVAGAETDSASDPILLRIQGLKRQIQAEETGADAQLAVLRGGGGDQRKAALDLQEALRKELSLLEAERIRLVVRAPIAGVVGSVNFRTGEKVPPFAPMVTISPRNPTLVRAYIQEQVYGNIADGDSVEVWTGGGRREEVHGLVTGLGARIVEFPVRLRKMPTISVWGREVVVRLPGSNPFLLGEQVVVRRLSRGSAP